MTTKLQNLFSTYEGKSPRQETYEGLYVKNQVDLEPVFEEAYQLALNDPTPEIFRGRGFMANHMSWYLIGLLKQKFPDRMEADQYDRPYYILNKSTRIYFKKLNKHYAPENVTTDHVRELNSMSMYYKEDPTIILYAGIKIEADKIWTDLNGFYLVEMRDLKKPNWVSDLSELGYLISKPKAIIPISTIQLPEEIIVKPKSKETDLGNTAEGD